MKSFFVLTLTGTVVATTMDQNDYAFINYVVKHQKNYNTMEEFNMRKANFKAMDDEIARLNQQNLTHTVAHNFLSDRTKEEKDTLLSLKNMPLPDLSNRTFRTFSEDEILSIPNSVDWKEAGKCSAVKTQGVCGSDWAFASTATMESAHAIFYSTGSITTLSA